MQPPAGIRNDLPIDVPSPIAPGPVLIVEDEPDMQRRLAAILTTSLGFAGEDISLAGDLTSARPLLTRQAFVMALVDVSLPDGNGIDLIDEVTRRDPSLPMLVISSWSADEIILHALRVGAVGYLLKERDDIEIALSIRSVMNGGAPIDPFIARRILSLAGATGEPRAASQRPPSAGPAPPLTGREIEILRMVNVGLTNREIADMLSLSKLTVECHVKNIYRKLGVASRTEAVFEARHHGLLP